MKFSAVLPAFAFFLLVFAFLIVPGRGASVSGLPGEEVILLPGGGYTTPSELANRNVDSVRHQEKTRTDANTPVKKKSRDNALRDIASTGPEHP